ncbi:MAG: ERF family protein [Clostridiaceae bacterium]|nr:ERF family protein [Clostridiaceae bacterium]
MSNKAGLYQKIHAIMKDVEYLQKDDCIQYKNTKYKAISEEKVTSTIRKSLVEKGLVILPIEQQHEKKDILTTVNTKYKILDTDTGEYEIIVSSGTGVDTQDKGVGKAMTYAYKYLLLRTFAIPTGEDPDKVCSAELDDKLVIDAEDKSNEDKEIKHSKEKKIQQNHIAALCALCSEKGVTEEQLKKVLEKDYGITSKKDLTIKQFKEVMERVKKVETPS